MSKDKQIRWTDQQARAISSRGGNVFVTASAGTGKTAVLSGRCIDLISDGAACPDVLNILVLTFTDAAAEQMRTRIGRQLREAFYQTHDPRLARQLILLQGADISTIHSFCKRLITEHFHELSLDPSFRVVDSDEAMLLKVETLAETVEWAWQQGPLSQGLHELLRGRDLRENKGFLSSVLEISDFLEGVVSPDAWCERARVLAVAANSADADLGVRQKQLIEERLNAILAQFASARKLYGREVPGGEWADGLEAGWVKPVKDCLARLKAGDWAGCVEGIQAARSIRKCPPKGLSGAVLDVVMGLVDSAARSLKGLSGLVLVNPEYLDIVGRSTGGQTRVLIELVQKFTRLYGEKKRALSGLDFADLERYALRLLVVQGAAGGSLAPSETALVLRKRYKYIFVDEYQDINPVQQAILDALSSGNNIFVVGDVKQSIYAWRGAEPTIFLQHLRPASVDPKDLRRGLRVDLNYNFRSAKGILDLVNKVFGRIMTSAIARIDYDDAARLRPGPQEEPQAPDKSKRPLVELHILDEKAGNGPDAQEPQDEETETSEDIGLVHARHRQAAMIAQRIRRMVGADTGRAEFQIHDSETESLRDVEYRDIVILMRSLAKKANDYVEILRLNGIPVSCDATAGYFEATEISDILCLLKVLDNPQRDIELAAVLRSPLLRLTDSDLAAIRLCGRDGSASVSYYACAARYRDAGPDPALRDRLRAAFERLERWRGLARQGDLAGLLWRVYRETSFIAFVSALPNGQARKANLLKLHDRAIQFQGFASNTGIASLSRFVEFIERLQEAGQDWSPAQPGSAAGNAVRILSVHKSKGLEFPVVFLAELESQFNRRSLYADMVVDADHAVGLQIIDPKSNTRLQSLAHQVIGAKKQAASLAEEMRILYVATTRAKDRLILTASQKRTDCGRYLANGLLLGKEQVPDWLLAACKNALEWILYGLSDQRALHEAFDTGLAKDARDDGLFEFQLHGREELQALSQLVLNLRARKASGSKSLHDKPRPSASAKAALAELMGRLSQPYPFVRAVRCPAKSSVTKLTHPDDEFALRDSSHALERQPTALVTTEPAASLPRDPSLMGTAVHLVIASLDLSQSVTARAIERTMDGLVKEGALTASMVESVDPDGILALFDSDLGRIVFDKANRVMREWPFTYAQPIVNSSAGEFVVVQGVVDMLVQTPKGLVVIDFKTDRVAGDEIMKRAEVYRGQVSLYADAAAVILERPVAAKWLYFLTARQAVQV
jgi:ATP-dependent helicase/nuclease subunit A